MLQDRHPGFRARREPAISSYEIVLGGMRFVASSVRTNDDLRIIDLFPAYATLRLIFGIAEKIVEKAHGFRSLVFWSLVFEKMTSESKGRRPKSKTYFFVFFPPTASTLRASTLPTALSPRHQCHRSIMPTIPSAFPSLFEFVIFRLLETENDPVGNFVPILKLYSASDYRQPCRPVSRALAHPAPVSSDYRVEEKADRKILLLVELNLFVRLLLIIRRRLSPPKNVGTVGCVDP